MIKGLFGPSSLTSMLRGGLEETSATHHRIAQRVAGTLDSSSNTDFAGQLEGKNGGARLDEVDLERDMTELADTQLRYEADAKLLQAAYQRLRSAITSRG
jgi:flagellar basal body rod protein FlgB